MKLLVLTVMLMQDGPYCWSGSDASGKDLFTPCHRSDVDKKIADLQAKVRALESTVHSLVDYIKTWEAQKAEARKRLDAMDKRAKVKQ